MYSIYQSAQAVLKIIAHHTTPACRLSSPACSSVASDDDGLVSIIGRCKGSCVCVGRDYVEERIPLADGRTLAYRQVEGSFSNPSAAMCAATAC